MQNEHISRMKELIALLDRASFAYYQEAREIMSDHEYDALYDELESLEKESGIVLSGSPTHRVGYTVSTELPKVSHARPMLSLDKTKSREELAAWLGSNKGELSWKMDGLTVVLTYENGTLAQAVTRGNGEIGELITDNARTFQGLPLSIPFHGRLTVRGEAVISYADFEKINSKLPPEEQYKNPRNLCSGSVRQLDSSVTAARHVHCILYTLIESEPAEGDVFHVHAQIAPVGGQNVLTFLGQLQRVKHPFRAVSAGAEHVGIIRLQRPETYGSCHPSLRRSGPEARPFLILLSDRFPRHCVP